MIFASRITAEIEFDGDEPLAVVQDRVSRWTEVGSCLYDERRNSKPIARRSGRHFELG